MEEEQKRPEEQKGLAGRIYLLFEEPNSSSAAYYVAVSIVSLIIISISAFVIQTLECRTPPYIPCGEEYTMFHKDVWYGIETICTIVFTIEYVSRIMACHVGGTTKLKFALGVLNIFDLLAIVPFYIELMLKALDIDGGAGIQALRLVRVARVLRLFKLFRYSVWLQLVGEGMRRSAGPVSILLGVLMMMALVLSSLVYNIEYWMADLQPGQGYDCSLERMQEVWKENKVDLKDQEFDETGCPAFTSIPETFYWAITTMTTVGYGDLTPKTGFGRFVAMATMFCGILLLALPVIVVGGKFQEVHGEYEARQVGGGTGPKTGVDFLLNQVDEVWDVTKANIDATEATCNACMGKARSVVTMLRTMAEVE